MPPRIARSNVQLAAPKNARNKNRKRNLDAYAIASHQTGKERRSVAPHRLGESIDDNPRQKRRRVEDDDDGEDDDASEDDSAPRRKLPPGRGRGIAEEDGVEEGSDSEGNEWRLGGLRIDDEDSDLDSDEAFGESDEEKFEGFTFRGSTSNSSKKPVKRKARPAKEDDGEEINLDEADAESGDEEEEDDFGDEGVDLATMLDDEDEGMLGGKDHTHDDMGEESASEDEDEESASEAESEDEEDGADNEERMARLRDRLEAMDEQPASRTARPAESGMLSVDDLLEGLDPAAKKQYAAALKTKKKSQAPKTLTAPLPKRQQDRLDRGVASQKAKEQLDRWRDTVIHNRRAEFLSFPLQDPNRGEPIGKAKFDTQGAPQNELEQNIQRIMEESGMATKPGHSAADEEAGEEALLKAEELGTNNLPLEEVMQRRANLRRARELLFREEMKARRIAKIKSKSYRRVHRKERERQAEKERALMDPEGLGLPLDEDERDRNDRKRAEERMSTKHRDSKWAKSLKATNRTVWDEGARGSVHDQARRQEELRRRIAGDEISDDEEMNSDVPSGSEDGDDDAEDAATLKQLDRLKQNGSGVGQKGVGGMKFMRAAEDRKRAQNEEDIERLRKEMAVADGDEAEESEKEDGGLGRAIFGPRGREVREPENKAMRPELEEGDVSEDEERREGGEEQASVAETKGQPQHQRKQAPKGNLKKTNGASGPLAKGLPRDRRDTAVAEAPKGSTSSWLDTVPKKSKKDQQRGKEVADGAYITNDTVSTRPGAQSKASKPASKSNGSATANGTSTASGETNGWQIVPYANANTATNDDASDAGPEENPMLSQAQQKASLYARAFAGDDVQAAFEAEKAADISEQDEKEVSTHLPGWGSWTGDGLSKSLKRANKKSAHNPLYKHKLPGGVKPEDRKDRGMEKVIVSEKQERKGKKYMAPMLPHEFERREQYERSLRVPVGPEWTTKETFQRSTRPRVVVKPGSVVEAMERPLM